MNEWSIILGILRAQPTALRGCRRLTAEGPHLGTSDPKASGNDFWELGGGRRDCCLTRFEAKSGNLESITIYYFLLYQLLSTADGKECLTAKTPYMQLGVDVQ